MRRYEKKPSVYKTPPESRMSMASVASRISGIAEAGAEDARVPSVGELATAPSRDGATELSDGEAGGLAGPAGSKVEAA